MELTKEQVQHLVRTIDTLDGVVAQVRLPRGDTLAALQLVQTAKMILQPPPPKKPPKASKPPR